MSVSVLVGDTREVLKTLPPESVACCVTSPPYWGLRDYGTGRWEGGDEACDHKGMPLASSSSSLAGYSSENVKLRTNTVPFRSRCGKCGAVRIDQQIGIEETPEAYVARLVEVFREVRRVLKKDGTLWLNLGDSYAAQRGGTQMPAETLAGGVGGHSEEAAAFRGRRRDILSDAVDRSAREPNPARLAHRDAARIGLKHKDLVGIPWRVAFALQADGWYLRSDIIWHKPNPMPESVTDRPTKAHEYVFLLTKSARYWYDAVAIKETSNGAWNSKEGFGGDRKKSAGNPLLRTQGHGSFHPDEEQTGRNARSVWSLATQPYPEAHFATFPPELPRRCIRAGCPVGGTVLDPFCGSGTTGAVAVEEGRDFVGIELNPAYIELSKKRIRAAQPPLLLEGR